MALPPAVSSHTAKSVYKVLFWRLATWVKTELAHKHTHHKYSTATGNIIQFSKSSIATDQEKGTDEKKVKSLAQLREQNSA